MARGLTPPLERVAPSLRTQQLPPVDVPALLAALPDDRLVLAVSGGRDSMALLEAAALAVPGRIAAVATFDHGTGAAATEAADLVARRARALGLRVARGTARAGVPGTEAAWRDARWRFLRRVARRHDAVVVTAHTRDDQLETVVMRLLRGSGARGIAGMLVEPPAAPVVVRRPLLGVPRAALAAWARAHGVAWRDDPTNASPRWLRNRVRHELMPAMERATPGIGETLLAIAARAADVRRTLDDAARRLSHRTPDGRLVIAAADLAGYDGDALAALWPALAARLGLALDRRGTSRAAAFTMRARTGGTVPLSGGFDLVRRPRDFVLQRTAPASVEDDDVGAGARALAPGLTVGGWRFRRARRDERQEDAWQAELPADQALSVRAWRAGDRMRVRDGGPARRVKRFFGDARVPGMDRAGWPVVLAGGEIVWIPGVRRADAATDRSGRPGVRYLCERIRS